MLGIPGITRYFKQYDDFYIQVEEVINSLIPYVYSMALAVQTASVYLTVTITIERYLAVCYPFKAREFCTRGRARKAIIFVVLFSVAYNIIRFFEYGYDDNQRVS